MGNQHWKSLSKNNKERIWYDETFLDNPLSNKFNIWILQMYNPSLEFQEIPERVYRSKIQYAINLKIMKYGMSKVVYYGINNKMIYNFDYHLFNYADSIKFSYPINDNPILIKVFDQIRKRLPQKSRVTE